MAQVEEGPLVRGWWLLSSPWPCLAGGIVVTAAGAGLLQAGPGAALGGILLLVAGIIAAVGGVVIRLRVGGERFEERLVTAGVIALAAAVPFLGACTLPREWDTAILLLGVVVTVLLVCALLCLLPQTPRLLLASLLAIVHFGGILTAINSVQPPGNREVSWLVSQVWTHLYRPYLEFMFLGNAYHFYSPEPGPPTLLWFYIEYEDGTGQWVKIPQREDYSNKTAYLRRIAMAEGTNAWTPNTPLDFERRLQRRVEAGKELGIPLDPRFHQTMQYRYPLNYGRRLTRYYAQHAATHYPHPENPELKVKHVKVYRVTRNFIQPGDLAKGMSPWDPSLYLAFYQGTFDANGNYAKDPQKDPFLYWLIPILKQGPDGNLLPNQSTTTKFEIKDYLEVHAHSN